MSYHPVFSILESCESVHMATTGAGDFDYYDDRRKFLQARIKTWTPGKSPKYDNAVKHLIEVVLEESTL